jgi:hypothetical protein
VCQVYEFGQRLALGVVECQTSAKVDFPGTNMVITPPSTKKKARALLSVPVKSIVTSRNEPYRIVSVSDISASALRTM